MNRARMMLPVAALVVVALVATGLLWDSALGQEKDKDGRAAVKWEYKVVDYKSSKGGKVGPDDMETDLNKLGNDGWECAGTVSLVGGGGGGGAGGFGGANTTTSRVILKRPKT